MKKIILTDYHTLLISELNKCVSIDEIKSFEKIVDGFTKKDAPKVLTDYLYDSIKNKTIGMKKIANIDFGKLRAILKQDEYTN